jgi:hypothetical protein
VLSSELPGSKLKPNNPPELPETAIIISEERKHTRKKGGKEVGKMLMPTKILVPTDFSEPSDRALKQALDIARQYHAKVLPSPCYP